MEVAISALDWPRAGRECRALREAVSRKGPLKVDMKGAARNLASYGKPCNRRWPAES